MLTRVSSICKQRDHSPGVRRENLAANKRKRSAELPAPRRGSWKDSVMPGKPSEAHRPQRAPGHSQRKACQQPSARLRLHCCLGRRRRPPRMEGPGRVEKSQESKGASEGRVRTPGRSSAAPEVGTTIGEAERQGERKEEK